MMIASSKKEGSAWCLVDTAHHNDNTKDDAIETVAPLKAHCSYAKRYEPFRYAK